MRHLLHDLRVGVRSLRRSASFTIVSLLMLGCGIGVATAVFGVADTLIRRPLPVHDQDRLVVLWGATRDGRFDNYPLLLSHAREFAERVRSLDRVEFFSSHGATPVSVRRGDEVIRFRRALVSGGYFDLLGTAPLLGRSLSPEDDVQGAAPVVVLSHGAWQRYFGGDPEVVGRQLTLHGSDVVHTIVGVMPQGLDYPRGTDLWAPVIPNSMPLGDEPIYAELSIVGRLHPGTSPADARAELTTYFERPDAPLWHRDAHGVVHPLTNAVLGDFKPAVLAFAAAAALLLLITCFNMANLLLVRGLGRAREIAVRCALGARRRRIAGQLLTESGLLAIGGGILGMGVAAAAVHTFIAMAPSGTPRLDEIEVRRLVALGAFAVTAIVLMFFTAVAVVITSRTNLQHGLRSGLPQSGVSRRFRYATEALIVGQVALTMVVLSVAGVIARSLLELQRADLSLEPSQLLFAELATPYGGFGDTQRQLAIVERLVPRLEQIPGISSVAPVLTPPYAGSGGIVAQVPSEEQSAEEGARNPPLTVEVVTPAYFETLGIPVLRGRGFSDQDRAETLPVAILSAAAARFYWPNEDPIGKRLAGPLTIVGVVPDTRYQDLRDPRPNLYLPLPQTSFPVAPMTLAIRTDGSAPLLASTLRKAIAEVDPTVAVASTTAFRTLRDAELAQPRLNAMLLGVFALTAVALAAVGLFSVLTTMVRRRSRELGLRIALGSTAFHLGGLVLRRGLGLAAAGIAIGLCGAIVSNRLLGALLFGVTPTDPQTLGLVAVLLLVVAALASLIPTRMSTRIDPIVALRAE